MTLLQETFLSMIRSALFDLPFKYNENVKVVDLYNEACRYEIAGLMSTKLDTFCLDDIETRKKWSKKAMNDYLKSLRVLKAQSDLCKLLEKENIKPVILKGMASAYYYKEPLLRQIGDIDFIVLPEIFDICCKLLEENGFVKGIDGIRHIEYNKQQLEYECHRYFSVNITSSDKEEDRIIYEGCRNAITREVEQNKYYALPDIEYGIVLLEHLKHHLVDGVGFRQILDFVVYANAILDDNTWNNKFYELAKKCKLDRLAKTITKTAKIYLGLNNNITWCDDIKNSLCSDFIELIFSCNNFGFVNEKEEKTHQIGNIYRMGFFKQLNNSALTHMTIAKKIIILRPIAWIYQLFRWLFKGIKSFLNNKKQDNISIKKLRKEKKLLKEIGV